MSSLHIGRTFYSSDVSQPVLLLSHPVLIRALNRRLLQNGVLSAQKKFARSIFSFEFLRIAVFEFCDFRVFCIVDFFAELPGASGQRRRKDRSHIEACVMPLGMATTTRAIPSAGPGEAQGRK